MASASLWSEAEDNAIQVYYPDHGRSWDGWAEVLPNRTLRAIQMRAQRLGATQYKVPQGERPKRRKKPREGDERHHAFHVTPSADPMERVIANYMRDGYTPSEIDAMMKWPPNRTAYILTQRWDRESGGNQ